MVLLAALTAKRNRLLASRTTAPCVPSPTPVPMPPVLKVPPSERCPSAERLNIITALPVEELVRVYTAPAAAFAGRLHIATANVEKIAISTFDFIRIFLSSWVRTEIG